MSWAEYKSKANPRCGVDGCNRRFAYRKSWVAHCKRDHPAYFDLWLNAKKESSDGESKK